MLWQRRGIAAPAVVIQATADYQSEQDILGQFLAECCELGVGREISATILYQAYEGWAKQLGLHFGSGTKFGTDLTRRGVGTHRKTSGNVRTGIDLNSYGRTFGPTVTPHWSDKE